MLKTALKYLLSALLLGFVAYNSVYLKKLSELKAAEVKPFDAKGYAQNYLYKKLPTAFSYAPEIDQLLSELKANSKSAFKKYAHAQSTGTTGYFLISGEGEIISLTESNIIVKSGKGTQIKLATEYIFGNTVRDAAGLISMDEFSNSMDINNVSEELNKLIKTNLIPPVKAKAKKGDRLAYKGCFELNRSVLKLDNIEIIPVSLTLKNER